jgi:hypothetical protein
VQFLDEIRGKVAVGGRAGRQVKMKGFVLSHFQALFRLFGWGALLF